MRFERVNESAPSRPKAKQAKRRPKPSIDVEGVDMGPVATSTATKLRRRLGEAASAFQAERYTDAERMLSSIERITPEVPEVLELKGLSLYRLGRWKLALKSLERFSELTGSVDQHPVMADCNRALKRWDAAERLWFELGDASPSPDLVEEGRIVQAGALADRGRIPEAISFLDRAPKPKGRPGVHHLRRWYMLGDLYERAGDNARARRLFADITTVDADFGDAAERATNLG